MSCPQCNGRLEPRVVRIQRGIWMSVVGVGLILAYFLTGGLLHDVAEGLERSLLPWWELWMPLALLAIGGIASVIRLRRPVCEACGAVQWPWLFSALGKDRSEKILAQGATRRVFLRTIGAGGAAVAAAVGGVAAAVGRDYSWIPVARDIFFAKVQKTAPVDLPAWKGAHIKNYRRLGRTNAMVSDISLGSGQIHDVAVARMAIERGINYFDTAPDYSDTASERVLGEAMKGHRDKMFVATKFCVRDGHLPNDTPVPKVIEAVEGSLKRLQTDHVDLIHIHSCDRLDRLMAPNIHEAFDRLKEQGKARFLGVSTHTPNLEEIANAAIDSGRFDVMMMAYNFGLWPHFGHILEKAKKHDVGIVAMKTLKGAKHANLADFRTDSSSYAQAAFRWVLSNPNVSCLVVSFFNLEQCDEYIYASGAPVRSSDVALLQRYDELTAGDYCQPHCGECLDSCAYGLPINDVLRYRMYFKDYGWQKEGMRLYTKLEQNAAACASCAAPCAGTCPIGVPVREKMMDAHRALTFPA